MEKGRPIVFGVAGGTASGKTTIANKLLAAIGVEQVAYLPHDAYYRHRPALTFEARTAVNYDHPDSLETDLLVEHVGQLLRGEGVNRPNYDFSQHLRSPETIAVQPSPIILVEGILIFTDPQLLALLDVKVYVDTDSDVRFIRRLRRDWAERGRSTEAVIEQYLGTVRPMHTLFVEPSKRHADIIIPDGGLNQIAIDFFIAHLNSFLDQPTDTFSTYRQGHDSSLQ